MPDPLLVIAYFFHLVATVVWIGGLVLLALVVWPASQRILGDDPRLPGLLAALRRRFTPLANLSLAVLVVTGLIQMAGDPNYDGLLIFDNLWSQAILLKHLAVGGMIVVAVVLQWGVFPAQERAALLRAQGKAPSGEAERLARRERQLHLASVALSVVVLGFTALATAL